MTGRDTVGVGVTMQEHAEDTRAANPPQFDANEGIGASGDAVYVGQASEAAEDCWMNCLRQLS